MKEYNSHEREIIKTLHGKVPKTRSQLSDRELECSLNLDIEKSSREGDTFDELYSVLLKNENMFLEDQIDYLKAYRFNTMDKSEFKRKYPNYTSGVHAQTWMNKLEGIYYGLFLNKYRILKEQYLEVKDTIDKDLYFEDKVVCDIYFSGLRQPSMEELIERSNMDAQTINNSLSSIRRKIRKAYAEKYYKKFLNICFTLEEIKENVSNPRYQKMAELSLIDGLNNSEIGRMFDVSSEAVKHILVSAKADLILDKMGIVHFKMGIYSREDVLNNKDVFTDDEWVIICYIFGLEGKQKHGDEYDILKHLNISYSKFKILIGNISAKLRKTFKDGSPYIQCLLNRYIDDERTNLSPKEKEILTQIFMDKNPHKKNATATIRNMFSKIGYAYTGDITIEENLTKIEEYLKYIDPSIRKYIKMFFRRHNSLYEMEKEYGVSQSIMEYQIAYLFFLINNCEKGFDYDYFFDHYDEVKNDIVELRDGSTSPIWNVVTSYFGKDGKGEVSKAKLPKSVYAIPNFVLQVFRGRMKKNKCEYTYDEVLEFYRIHKDTFDIDTREMFESYLMEGSYKDKVNGKVTILKYLYDEMQRHLNPDYVKLDEVSREHLITILKELNSTLRSERLRKHIMAKFNIYPRELMSHSQVVTARDLEMKKDRK